MIRAPFTAVLFFSLAACAVWSACGASPWGTAEPHRPIATAVSSNIERGAYVGSEVCLECHADLAEGFNRSPMRRMTSSATAVSPKAPFDGTVFEQGGDRVRMFMDGDRHYMKLESKQAGERLYRITKIVGGRVREDFVGTEVESTSPAAPSLDDARGERIMPVSYLLFNGEWRYKGYSVMIPERPGMRPGASWKQTCMFCHNTTPLLTTLYDDLSPTKVVYQGSATDRLLPPDRLFGIEVTNEGKLSDAIRTELSILHIDTATSELDELAGFAAETTRKRFDQTHLVELGIGCEACHLGGKEHAEDPGKPIGVWPEAEFLELVAPQGGADTEAARINRSCLRCHGVLFTQYDFTWEGRRRRGIPGGSNINSGEARNFLLGGCHEEMHCADCHDPHNKDDKASLTAFKSPSSNHRCTSCHQELRADAAERAHTRHKAGSDGAACAACHMPKKNIGLTYDLTRYHRIGAPTEADRIYGDRPLECALCHTDWSPTHIVDKLEAGWGIKVDRTRLAGLYSDLDKPTLKQTIAMGKPHEQAAAVGALADRGDRDNAPWITPVLAHPMPLIRYIAADSLERLIGCAPPVSLFGDASDRLRRAREWLEADAPCPSP